MAVPNLQLANYGRLQALLVSLSLLTALLCPLLFGLLWTLVLLFFATLSFYFLSLLCYRPEGREWRERLERSYALLFQNLFGTSVPPPGSEFEDGARNHHANKPSGGARAGTPLASSRPFQPHVSTKCHREAQKVIRLIMRDFVSVWYDNITVPDNGSVDFPDDVQKILEHIALEVSLRVQRIDLNETVCELLSLVLMYFEVVNETGRQTYRGVEIFDLHHAKSLRAFEANPKVSHRALKSTESETAYYRQGLDVLIQAAVPAEYRNCDIACTFIREILLENILVPLLDLLTSPDFINKAIPLILNKAPDERIRRELADIDQENEELEEEIAKQSALLLKQQDSRRKRFWSLSGRFDHSAIYLRLPQRAKTDDGRASVMAAPIHEYTSSELKPTTKRPPETGARMAFDPEGYMPTRSTSRGAPFSSHPAHPLNQHPPLPGRRDFIRSQSAEVAGSAPLPDPRSQSVDAVPSSRESSVSPELGIDAIEEVEEERGGWVEDGGHDDELVHIQLPPIHIKRHVNVDRGGRQHVAYIFQFPRRMLTEADLMRLGVPESETCLESMKRYSEFVTFHDSLQRSPLAARIKSCELPDRRKLVSFMSKLPFTGRDPDPTIILERKEGLEQYLRSISGVQEVADGKLFREFLISGVEAFREVTVVTAPARGSGHRKKSLLGMMKGHASNDDATIVSNALPRRHVEPVLTSFLDTKLPLPCQSLHSLNSLHVPPPPPSSSSRPGRLSPSSSLTQSEVDGSMPTAESSLNISSGAPREGAGGATDSDTFRADKSSTLIGGYEYVIIDRPGSESSSTPSHGGSTSELGVASCDIDVGGCLHHMRQRSNSSPVEGGEEPERDEMGSCLRSRLSLQSVSSSYHSLGQLHSSSEVSITAGVGSLATPEEPRSLNDSEGKVNSNGPSSGVELPANETTVTPQANAMDRIVTRVRLLFVKLTFFLSQLLSFSKFVFKYGYPSLLQTNMQELYRERRRSTPLANALLSLMVEGTKVQCPEFWANARGSQLAVLTLTGGAMDQFLWKELDEVVYCEENWTRALYHLRHTLWPNGALDSSPRKRRSEQERVKDMEKAIESFKRFLPGFCPYLIGSSDYDCAVKHCLECLQNTRMNRHFFLAVIDLLLTKMVPEIREREFRRHLAKLRTHRQRDAY